MRSISNMVGVAAAASVLAFGSALAGSVKDYQITGPVVSVDDAKIVVETKDDGKWEIARTADTKVIGELKVGAKVTATSVEAKDAKPSK